MARRTTVKQMEKLLDQARSAACAQAEYSARESGLDRAEALKVYDRVWAWTFQDWLKSE